MVTMVKEIQIGTKTAFICTFYAHYLTMGVHPKPLSVIGIKTSDSLNVYVLHSQ